MTQLKKAFLFAFAVLGGLFVGISLAQAQPSEAGPFINKIQLINYWQSKTASSPYAHDIGLNGQLVFSRPGAAPGKVFIYFQCNDGKIYGKCNDIRGPYPALLDIDSATEGLASASTWRTVLDSVQRAQSGAGPYATEFHFITCPGSDARFNYFMLSQATTANYGSFGPYTGTLCLPAL